jgi:oligopeptide transport system substrate-binding protein
MKQGGLLRSTRRRRWRPSRSRRPSFPSANPGLPRSETPKPEEFVVAFNVLDLQLDPHHSIYSAEAQIFTAVYEGLFSYDPNSLDPVKAACRSYNRSQDGKTYTFYIRDEARWSDGSPLLARDFRDAWLRALDPATKADYVEFFDVIAGAHDFRTGKTSDPSSVGISVIADKILQVKLESKADYFTRLLCHHSFSPIHPSMLKVKDWRAALPFPVDGPYAFKSFDSSGLLLVKNEKYWDAASVKDPAHPGDLHRRRRRRDEALRRRSIHWLAGPWTSTPFWASAPSRWGRMFSTHYWFFDCGTAPWTIGMSGARSRSSCPGTHFAPRTSTSLPRIPSSSPSRATSPRRASPRPTRRRPCASSRSPGTRTAQACLR